MVNAQPTHIERSELDQYHVAVDVAANFLAQLTALVGVDPQTGFTRVPVVGRLATAQGHEVMEPTNEVAKLPIWAHRRLTKDWHPTWHVSYVEIRSDLAGDPQYDSVPYILTFDEFETWTPGNMPIVQEAQFAGINYDNLGEYLSRAKFQILWPRGRHCEQGSADARFHPYLDQRNFEAVTPKGTINYVDSLGAFADNGGMNETDLDRQLKDLNIANAVLIDLCTEYCVETSATQAVERGYGAMVLTDCVRPVNVNPDDEAKAFARMFNQGILLANIPILKAAARKLGKIA